MDVTRENFEKALCHLERELESCAFVSFDTEFTGLGEERPSHLDTPSDRYRTAKEYSRAFPPLQFGLTLFREVESFDGDDDVKNAASGGEGGEKNDPNGESMPEASKVEVPDNDGDETLTPATAKVSMWEMVPFNFWLCPRALYRTRRDNYPIRDRIMQVQASTIDFLCKNGFDFQKSFNEGVSWMRKNDEISARAELVASYKPRRPFMAKMDKRETTVVEKFTTRVKEEWFDKETTKEGSSTFFALADFNVNRSLLIRAAESRFPNVCATIVDGGRKIGLPPSVRLEVLGSKKKASEKRREEHKRDYMRKLEDNMREAVGFRRVMDLLLKAKKPLVVHHGLFDTTKLVANFIGNLPETLSGFKRMLTEHFPIVWDTRVLLVAAATRYPWLSSLLATEQGRHISGIIDELRQHKDDVPSLSLRVVRKWEFERYDDSHAEQFSHEAGFDALQTGRLLLYLISMGLQRPTQSEDVISAWKHEKLGPMHNRMYLGSCGGYTDIALNETAGLDACLEVEEAVEDARNEWMTREDVLVMSGVEDEESKKLEVWEIPYQHYRRVLDVLFEGTPYCARESRILPCADGACIFIAKKSRSGSEPRRKRARTNGIEKSSGDDSLTTSTTAAPRTSAEDVATVGCSDESGISEEDKRKIVETAKQHGIEIRSYREALRSGKAWRMRFLL